jgi:monoterpene epsilon-lactone hydrolase
MRLVDRYVRTVIRRHDWGAEEALALRARRHFGAPRALQRLARARLHHRVVTNGQVRGEWLSGPDPGPGVLLYVHGGGYVACSAATHRPLTAHLARLLRCRVFSTDYRTAPEARFPAAFEDVLATYKWLCTDGARGQPIAVAGESAGGGLVVALAQHARDAGWPAPACLVALSPWTDLAGTGPSIHENNGRCAMFRPGNIAAFAAVYLAGAAADDPRASPLYGDTAQLPPVLLQVGSTELLLDDARRVHERIVARGGTCRLTVYDDVVHGWQLLVPFVPEATVALAEVASFVRPHLTTVTVGPRAC